ncbi:MAG: SHOCT domain-containing protein [Gammaproteobacteria bacterium]|nr:SHOCT domain-containing protein [Gammaproteobacteria bacterium]MCK5262902.1 SHOCT domain-containing protein [Gammaproteobacteria bacterium]
MKAKIIINAVLLVLLSACNDGLINNNHNEISVRSEPSGASVYVMGKLQGTTPMKLNVTKLYPVSYSKKNKHQYGHITLKHESCSDKVVKVTRDIGGTGVKGELVCAPSEETMIEQVPAKVPAVGGKTVKQRLQELHTLKDDGLISDEEYQKVRSKILESL